MSSSVGPVAALGGQPPVAPNTLAAKMVDVQGKAANPAVFPLAGLLGHVQAKFQFNDFVMWQVCHLASASANRASGELALEINRTEYGIAHLSLPDLISLYQALDSFNDQLYQQRDTDDLRDRLRGNVCKPLEEAILKQPDLDLVKREIKDREAKGHDLGALSKPLWAEEYRREREADSKLSADARFEKAFGKLSARDPKDLMHHEIREVGEKAGEMSNQALIQRIVALTSANEGLFFRVFDASPFSFDLMKAMLTDLDKRPFTAVLSSKEAPIVEKLECVIRQDLRAGARAPIKGHMESLAKGGRLKELAPYIENAAVFDLALDHADSRLEDRYQFFRARMENVLEWTGVNFADFVAACAPHRFDPLALQLYSVLKNLRDGKPIDLQFVLSITDRRKWQVMNMLRRFSTEKNGDKVVIAHINTLGPAGAELLMYYPAASAGGAAAATAVQFDFKMAWAGAAGGAAAAVMPPNPTAAAAFDALVERLKKPSADSSALAEIGKQIGEQADKMTDVELVARFAVIKSWGLWTNLPFLAKRKIADHLVEKADLGLLVDVLTSSVVGVFETLKTSFKLRVDNGLGKFQAMIKAGQFTGLINFFDENSIHSFDKKYQPFMDLILGSGLTLAQVAEGCKPYQMNQTSLKVYQVLKFVRDGQPIDWNLIKDVADPAVFFKLLATQCPTAKREQLKAELQGLSNGAELAKLFVVDVMYF